MRAAIAAVALGAALATPAMVRAETFLDLGTFTIQYTDGDYASDWSFTLLEQTSTTYRFSLDTMNLHLTGAEAVDLAGAGGSAVQGLVSQLHLQVVPDYRLASARVTGVADGALTPGQLPGFPPGVVTNSARFSMAFSQGSIPYTYTALHDNFQAEVPFDLVVPPYALPDSVNLDFSGLVTAQAWGVAGGGATAESSARASIRDIVLEVNVTAVPEPATWAMLAAGAVLLGATARARRLP